MGARGGGERSQVVRALMSRVCQSNCFLCHNLGVCVSAEKAGRATDSSYHLLRCGKGPISIPALIPQSMIETTFRSAIDQRSSPRR